MITIIVGVPGAGKTLYVMSKLYDEYKDRQVYHYNIPGVTVPEWKELENPERWHQLPHGSVVIIDEAHKVFPKRDHRVKEPEHIEAAAELRHIGLDLVLITQHPVDLDIFLRRRCARFIYLKKPLSKGNYANAFMWGEYNENYKDEREQEKSDNYQFSYPLEAFDRYTSAEIHTGKRYMPVAAKRSIIIMVIGLVAAVSGFVYAFNGHIGGGVDDESSINLPTSQKALLTDMDYMAQYLPRVPGLPFTAPVYDDIVKPKVFPRLQCVSSVTSCKCYTQQATKLYIPDDICRRYVTDGLFDFTRSRSQSSG